MPGRAIEGPGRPSDPRSCAKLYIKLDLSTKSNASAWGDLKVLVLALLLPKSIAFAERIALPGSEETRPARLDWRKSIHIDDRHRHGCEYLDALVGRM
ncbi:hypothetical protein FA13DRAFT_1727475 [Coprinellus micaceus]|uniref:Uncharacterized protein n=1 Tax=Coprinellus micaceus TaxID=71717 RepID=A0A4Y7TP46_COPMI|nr:hypothetical protein FA13DRAFT_1727475 [Coprinellus micaceus]